MKSLACIFAIILVLAACNQTSDGESSEKNSRLNEVDGKQNALWPKTIVDFSGNRVIIKKRPKRIVLLHSVFLDYFFEMKYPPVATAGGSVGNGSLAIRNFNSLSPLAAKATSKIIDLGSARQLNLEAILSSNPDVIVTYKGLGDNIYPELQKIAPVVQVSVNETWKVTLLGCAEIIGVEGSELVEQLIQDTNKTIAKTKDAFENYGDVTFVLLRIDPKGNFVVIGSNYSLYFNKESGFGLTAPKDYPKDPEIISLEGLTKLNPDYIIFQHDRGITEAAIKRNESSAVWQSLKAVKMKHVVLFDDALNSYSPLAIRIAADKFQRLINN